MPGSREMFSPPWVVGLAVFLALAVAGQLLLGGGALLVAIPSGLVAGALYRRRQRRSETLD